jgi:hypothetical protein
MSGSSACSVDTVIANETSFYTWLGGNRTCPKASDVYKAIQQGSNQNSNPSTSISNDSQDLKSLKKTLQQRQLDVQVAKDRAAMVKRPEMTASYYDGWFPLNRPLKTMSVPILIGLATLFFVFSILMFLELFGLKIRAIFENDYAANYLTENKFGKPFWIMSLFSGIFFALTLYLYFFR